MLRIEPRKKPITDAEWVIDAELRIGDQRVAMVTLHYADSQLAKDPEGVGWLIASRLQQEAVARSTKGKRK